MPRCALLPAPRPERCLSLAFCNADHSPQSAPAPAYARRAPGASCLRPAPQRASSRPRRTQCTGTAISGGHGAQGGSGWQPSRRRRRRRLPRHCRAASGQPRRRGGACRHAAAGRYGGACGTVGATHVSLEPLLERLSLRFALQGPCPLIRWCDMHPSCQQPACGVTQPHSLMSQIQGGRSAPGAGALHRRGGGQRQVSAGAQSSRYCSHLQSWQPQSAAELLGCARHLYTAQCSKGSQEQRI